MKSNMDGSPKEQEAEVKKRRSRLNLTVVIGIIVVTVVVLYIKLFNGSIVYISTGFGKDKLFKVEKESVYIMEAKILMSDAKSEYEDVFGNGIWVKPVGDITIEQYAKEQVKAKLIRVQCMNIMAKEKGIVLSREYKEAVNNAVDEYYAGLTTAQIDEYRITKDKLTDMFTEFAIAETLYQDMTDSMSYEISLDEARVISIQYICADTQEEINEAKLRIDAGETFYLVAKDYTGDDYERDCKRGEMDEKFETAAFNLKTGEVSDVITAKNKYYIVKCTNDNDSTKTEANKLALADEKKLDAFNLIFEQYEAKKLVTVNEKAWDTLSVSNTEIVHVSFEKIFNKYFK